MATKVEFSNEKPLRVDVEIKLISNGFVLSKCASSVDGVLHASREDTYAADSKTVIKELRNMLNDPGEKEMETFDNSPTGLFIAIERKFTVG